MAAYDEEFWRVFKLMNGTATTEKLQQALVLLEQEVVEDFPDLSEEEREGNAEMQRLIIHELNTRGLPVIPKSGELN